MSANIYALAVRDGTAVTIATGAIEVSQTYVVVSAEIGTTDDLDTVTFSTALTSQLVNSYGTFRPFVILRAASGHTITVTTGVGNVALNGGSSFSLSGDKQLMLFYSGSAVTDLGAGGGGSGTVTSVGLSTNASYLTIGGSPVTTSGTITANKTTGLTQNQVVATPDGVTGPADLRALVAADIPNLATSKITSGQLALARGGTGADLSATGGANSFVKQSSAGANLSVGTIGTSDLPTIPISGGGTGQTTQTAAFDALAPTTTQGDMIYYDGSDNVRLPKGTALQQLRMNAGATAPEWFTNTGSAPLYYKSGLRVTKQTAAILEVGIGEMTVESTLVSKTTTTLLNMATAGDWIGGSSLESASEYVCQYMDAAGNIKLYDKMPNYPRANTASRVATMRVNQSGWNGTSGSGLNATSVVYDTDTGAGSVTAGMLLGVFSDSTYETGRGRGSGASASVNNASYALITAINTGTNTLTLAAGHNIALNDDDYLIVIEFGALEYIQVSGTWWRFIGRIYNDSGSDLDDNRLTKRAFYTMNEGADITSTSATFVAVSSKLSLSILTSGGDIRAEFAGMSSNAANYTNYDFALDGIAPSDDGTINNFVMPGNIAAPFALHRQFGVLPGTHTMELQWKTPGGTNTLYAGAGTSGLDNHPQMTVTEVLVQ